MKNARSVSAAVIAILVIIIVWRQWTFHDDLQPEPQQGELAAESGSGRDVSPVKIGVYYETLCPDSIRFVREQLWNTFQKLSQVIDVELIPYGKASSKSQGNDRWTFRCQHGPNECRGNMMQACAIKYNPSQQKIVPFVHCVMTAGNPPNSGKQCAEKTGLDWNQISQCAEGAEGESLLHDMGVKTDTQKPRIHFIPWITINGDNSDTVQDQALSNLQSLVCRSYKGPTPSSCT